MSVVTHFDTGGPHPLSSDPPLTTSWRTTTSRGGTSTAARTGSTCFYRMSTMFTTVFTCSNPRT